VESRAPATPPILFDLGTGLRRIPTATFGSPCRVTALVTHLHFDHVQGLPFFEPAFDPAARIDVYAPAQEDGSAGDALTRLIRPPYFPVPLEQFQADLRFHDVCTTAFAVGDARVTVRPVPHVGPTVGYRVDADGASVAYVSDHQAPAGHDTVAESVLELCQGVDLLIHDAQYTPEEFAAKSDWGHCTVEYAVLVARESGAGRLCLFHHDPSHGDADLDAMFERGRALGEETGVAVVTASEGLTIEL
jgi:phosphoribosyl 1,2-cyclic phosphodiesterase